MLTQRQIAHLERNLVVSLSLLPQEDYIIDLLVPSQIATLVLLIL
jgi:hypothetical protein